ncbi:MAG: DegV family protein, partial [Clostridia bacterium]|nr:DegV family protein [Clostridia bacterium]
VLVITLSGGLSGTVDSARMAKQIADYDKIEVVDSHQAILTQRMLVEQSVKLREEGYQLQEIVQRIKNTRDQVVVCGVVDTLKYLQKGGRIPASLGTLGTLLRIKPVIILQDRVLKQLGKARGHDAGEEMLYKHMEQDGINKAYPVYFGYTSDRELAERFMQRTRERFGLTQTRLFPIGGVIGTHCGTRCVAVAYVKR